MGEELPKYPSLKDDVRKVSRLLISNKEDGFKITALKSFCFFSVFFLRLEGGVSFSARAAFHLRLHQNILIVQIEEETTSREVFSFLCLWLQNRIPAFIL